MLRWSSAELEYGSESDPPSGFTGTYTLNANCSGTITFIDPFSLHESIYFVLAENGAKLFGMYTTTTGNVPGPVVTIDFVKQ